MKYKFSDIVKAYDRDEKGVISFVYGQITNKPYSVNFESGYSDNYAEEDLQPWEEKPVLTEKSDPVEHPSHYMCHEMECIDEMLILFDKKAVMNFAALNAWKYRYRAGSKGSAEEDQKKADWYIAKCRELKEGK